MARIISHVNVTNDLNRFVNAPKRPTARTDSGATQSTDTSSSTDPAAGFRMLFSGGYATPTNNTPPPPPTAESVFGPNPWVSNPTCMGPDGQLIGYNPYYFASPQTAAKVAQMLGGKVVQSYQITPTGGAFGQMQPNAMVQLPDGRMVNPGLIASFYTHGYPQSYIDQMIASEVKNA
jgi:hypothetical protein